MIPGICVAIHTRKFHKMPGEDEELVNPGMYGRAICQYLQDNLREADHDIPWFCNEDWGWWIEVKGLAIPLGLTVYCRPDEAGNVHDYAVMSSVTEDKVWSWRKLTKVIAVDRVASVNRIMSDVFALFSKDREVERVSRNDDFPF